MDAQPKPRRAWPLRIARKLGISMLALLAGLGLAELGVRLFADVKPPVLLVDREVGRRYRANHAAPLFNPESQQTVMLRFNDQGLRFPSVPLKKPAGTKRLLVIGDSMIAGLEVEEEHTAMARFQAAMNARAEGPRWEVLNFGVSGSGTGQQLTLYQHLGRKYQPDMVWLSFYPGNDLADNSTRLSKSRRGRFDLDDQGRLVHNGYPDLRHRINGWLDKNSRLYVWQKDRTLKLKQAKQKEVRAEELGPSPYAWHGAEIRNSEWIYYTGEHEEADYSWAVTRAEILQFAKEVRADGAIFGVFVMPHNLQLNDDTFEFVRGLAGELGPQFDSRNPNRRIAEICAEADIVFHDPLDRFRAATPSHSSLAEDELLHYQGEHMNEKGHALTAEMLYDWLTQYDWENAAAR